MCGLFGVLGSEEIKLELYEMFLQLGVLSSFRGRDATGICMAYKKKSRPYYEWLRSTTPSSEFVFTKNVNEMWRRANGLYALMGHARHATIGKVTIDNTHPFEKDHIVGCHNGTIRSLGGVSGSTDSEELFARISKDGVDKALSSFHGDAAYALTWFDINASTFNILRNKERPLYYMQTVDHKYLLYASERVFLDVINCRNIRAFCKIEQFDTDKLYTFKVEDLSPTIREVKREYQHDFLKDRQPPKGTVPHNAEMAQKLADLRKFKGGYPDYYTGRDAPEIIPEYIVKRVKPTKTSIDRADDIFLYRMGNDLPNKIVIGGVCKWLHFKMHDGSWEIPVNASLALEAATPSRSQSRPTLNDRVLWFDKDSIYVREGVMDTFFDDALADPNYGCTEGYAAYMTLSTRAALRKEEEEKDNVVDATFAEVAPTEAPTIN